MGAEVGPGPAAASGTGRRAGLLRGAAAVAGLVLVLLLAREAGGHLPAFAEWVRARGAWGPVVFAAGYALATVAMVPGSLLTLAAGALFGVARGVAVVLAGATLGASLAFLVSRHLARPRMERRVAADPRFVRVDRAVAREGGRIVLLLRLSPVLPFNLLNYALGLTRVRFRDYLLASVGMIPGTVLYVYTGRVAGDLASLAAGAAPPRGVAHYLVLALGLGATAAVSVRLARIARAALRDERAA